MLRPHIEGKEKVIQLLECCDEQLGEDLTQNAGGSLASRSTEEVLEAIKKLAVREENAMVARVQLHKMRQGRDNQKQDRTSEAFALVAAAKQAYVNSSWLAQVAIQRMYSEMY